MVEHDAGQLKPEVRGSSVLVTVVIPTYNREQLVRRAVMSALSQSHDNLEIIVVDDGSPDNTKAVVEAIHDRRLRYLRHETNRGLPAARNTGIVAARGDYIAFLDDDDEWAPAKIHRQLVAIGDAAAVLCAARVNGDTIKRHSRPFVSLSDLRRGNPFDPSSLLARASLLKEIRFDESLRQGEDWDAFIRIARAGSIRYLDEPLLLYSDGNHLRMTNEARNMSIESLEKRLPMILKHREFFGPFWARFHEADVFLAYIAERRNKLRHLFYVARRFGVDAALAVLWSRIKVRLGLRR